MSTSEQTTTPKKPKTPNEKPSADLFDDTFVVKLMKGKKVEATFTLHKGVAAFSSDYFEAAMKKDTFEEAKNNCIELRDIKNIRAFGQLVGWMYTRDLDESGNETYLIDLWILADRFMVPFLGDLVINKIRDKSIVTSAMDEPLLLAAYKDSTENSGFQRFTIDLWLLTYWDQLGEQFKKSKLTKEMICDVLIAYQKHKAEFRDHWDWKVRVRRMNLCAYHSHKAGERCW